MPQKFKILRIKLKIWWQKFPQAFPFVDCRCPKLKCAANFDRVICLSLEKFTIYNIFGKTPNLKEKIITLSRSELKLKISGIAFRGLVAKPKYSSEIVLD
jgi:hypothetical protein